MAAIAAVLTAHYDWLATARSPFLGEQASVQVPARSDSAQATKPAAPTKPAVSSPAASGASKSSQSTPVGRALAKATDPTTTPPADAEFEAQEWPVSVGATVPPRGSPPAPAQTNFLGGTLFTLALTIAVATLSPLVFAFGFFFLLRRHAERFGALIQIHNAVAPTTGSPAANRRDAPLPRLEVRPAAPPKDVPPQGGALFERLFEETLELQMQIDGTDEKQQPAAEPV
jgi:hypothetical protein